MPLARARVREGVPIAEGDRSLPDDRFREAVAAILTPLPSGQTSGRACAAACALLVAWVGCRAVFVVLCACGGVRGGGSRPVTVLVVLYGTVHQVLPLHAAVYAVIATGGSGTWLRR